MGTEGTEMERKRFIRRNEIRGGSLVMPKKIHNNVEGKELLHWHDYFEITRVLRGEVRCFLDDGEILLGEGDSILVSPGCAHDSVSASEERSFSQVLQFPLPEDIPYRRQGGAMGALISSYYMRERARLIRRGDRDAAAAAFVCEEIYAAHTDGGARSENVIRGGLGMLLGYFSDEAAMRMLRNLAKHERELTEIFSFIDAGSLREIEMEKTAAHLGYSPAYFSHKFKEMTGIGFKEFVDRFRMREAMRMLSEGVSTADAAARIGYDCVQNFSRAFKRIHRMTPKESVRSKR